MNNSRDSFDGEKRSFDRNRNRGEKRPSRFNDRKEEGHYSSKRSFSKRGNDEDADERGHSKYKDGSGRREYKSREERGDYKRRSFEGGADKRPFIRSRQKRERTPEEGIRLNRFIANAGVCSRREADTFIESGVVKVNGKVVTEMGVKVMPGDTVYFHDMPLRSERKVYILLNKPKDTVTTAKDQHGRMTVMDLVAGACKERVYPVGRLDRNTTGVLLLTNDGDLAGKLTHPKYEKKKIYHAHLSMSLRDEDKKKILEGFDLEDGFIKADALEVLEGSHGREVGIEIHSGRNRIVRRIFESLGYKVEKLDRVYFAGLTKYNLPRGRWRFLTEQEINFLKMGAYE